MPAATIDGVTLFHLVLLRPAHTPAKQSAYSSARTAGHAGASVQALALYLVHDAEDLCT